MCRKIRGMGKPVLWVVVVGGVVHEAEGYEPGDVVHAVVLLSLDDGRTSEPPSSREFPPISTRQRTG